MTRSGTSGSPAPVRNGRGDLISNDHTVLVRVPDYAGGEEGRSFPSGLPQEVLDQIVTDLGERGEKVISSLRTAAHLITQARGDQTGLRLVESAAYNLREALDAVAAGTDAAPGGFPAVKAAYKRYQVSAAGPEADAAVALHTLAGEIARLISDGRRQNYRTRELLGWLTARTGIEPLPGDDDPSIQFDHLRERANSTLHSSGTVALAAALYSDVVAWFLRVFTPPDERLRSIVDLARTPYTHRTRCSSCGVESPTTPTTSAGSSPRSRTLRGSMRYSTTA